MIDILSGPKAPLASEDFCLDRECVKAAVSGHVNSPAPTADTAISAGLRGGPEDRVSSANGDAILAPLDAGIIPTPSYPHTSTHWISVINIHLYFRHIYLSL